MFEKFDESARRALFHARWAAQQAGHGLLTPEHLAAGVLTEPIPSLQALLLPRGLVAEELGSILLDHLWADRLRGWRGAKDGEEILLAPATKRVIHAAVRHQVRLRSPTVSAMHLLLALLTTPRVPWPWEDESAPRRHVIGGLTPEEVEAALRTGTGGDHGIIGG